MSEVNYTVLGGGLIGGFIARNLAADDDAMVTLVDHDPLVLQRNAEDASLMLRQIDLSDPASVQRIVAEADVVVGAVPGFLGYQTLAAVIEAGRPCVDISFFPDDARELDSKARQRGVPAIVDCGVMPGLGGMIAAHLSSRLDSASSLAIMVGGLPVERVHPFEYLAPFSPVDVIQEYIRPARLLINGMIVTRPALSDVTLVDFPGLGTLEAFNTDGLRSLLHTLDIPTMVEKTLRYPGHAARMQLLRDVGFLSDQPIEVAGRMVSPLSLSSKLLCDSWHLECGMREFTVMRVEVAGREQGRSVVLQCDLLDFTDPQTLDFSMSRTTGWPAILMARALGAGGLPALAGRTGLLFPEVLGMEESIFDYISQGLAAAGINLNFSKTVR